MGVTIHYTLGQVTKNVKRNLDQAQVLAETQQKQAALLKIDYSIRRESDTSLLIDIGNCETVSFTFEPFDKSFRWPDEVKRFEPFNSQGEYYEKFPDQRMLWVRSWCKTQFARSFVEHKWAADIVRCVAGKCEVARVIDESGYYHTGTIEHAVDAISECGALINGVAGMLTHKGYDVVEGGTTKIKSIRKKQR